MIIDLFVCRHGVPLEKGQQFAATSPLWQILHPDRNKELERYLSTSEDERGSLPTLVTRQMRAGSGMMSLSLKDDAFYPNIVISSPYIRARQTATELLSGIFGENISINETDPVQKIKLKDREIICIIAPELMPAGHDKFVSQTLADMQNYGADTVEKLMEIAHVPKAAKDLARLSMSVVGGFINSLNKKPVDQGEAIFSILSEHPEIASFVKENDGARIMLVAHEVAPGRVSGMIGKEPRFIKSSGGLIAPYGGGVILSFDVDSIKDLKVKDGALSDQTKWRSDIAGTKTPNGLFSNHVDNLASLLEKGMTLLNGGPLPNDKTKVISENGEIQKLARFSELAKDPIKTELTRLIKDLSDHLKDDSRNSNADILEHLYPRPEDLNAAGIRDKRKAVLKGARAIQLLDLTLDAAERIIDNAAKAKGDKSPELDHILGKEKIFKEQIKLLRDYTEISFAKDLWKSDELIKKIDEEVKKTKASAKPHARIKGSGLDGPAAGISA